MEQRKDLCCEKLLINDVGINIHDKINTKNKEEIITNRSTPKNHIDLLSKLDVIIKKKTGSMINLTL